MTDYRSRIVLALRLEAEFDCVEGDIASAEEILAAATKVPGDLEAGCRLDEDGAAERPAEARKRLAEVTDELATLRAARDALLSRLLEFDLAAVRRELQRACGEYASARAAEIADKLRPMLEEVSTAVGQLNALAELPGAQHGVDVGSPFHAPVFNVGGVGSPGPLQVEPDAAELERVRQRLGDPHADLRKLERLAERAAVFRRLRALPTASLDEHGRAAAIERARSEEQRLRPRGCVQ